MGDESLKDRIVKSHEALADNPEGAQIPVISEIEKQLNETLTHAGETKDAGLASQIEQFANNLLNLAKRQRKVIIAEGNKSDPQMQILVQTIKDIDAHFESQVLTKEQAAIQRIALTRTLMNEQPKQAAEIAAAGLNEIEGLIRQTAVADAKTATIRKSIKDTLVQLGD